LTGKERNTVGIAVALPVREVYTYSVPDHLATMAEVGRRTLVPFRNRKVIGYIIKKEIDPKDEGIKDILEFLDPGPLFNLNLVPFFQWMADYYLFPIGLLIQSALPAGINVTPFKTGRLTNEGISLIKSRQISSDERKSHLMFHFCRN